MKNQQVKLTLLERAFIARNLSLLIKSGVAVSEALHFLATQPKKKEIRRMLEQVHTDVSAGLEISTALEKHKNTFGGLFIRFVKIGEESGKLEETLEYLAVQYERNSDIQKKLKAAVSYPAIIFSIIIVYAIVFAYVIFPRLETLFTDFNAPLPTLTRVLLDAIDWLRGWGGILIIALIVLGVLISRAKKFPVLSHIREWILFHTPGLKTVYANFVFARMYQILGFMVQSGIPLPEAIAATAESIEGRQMKKNLKEVETSVSSGIPLSESMSTFPAFGSLSLRLLETAEKSGSLEQTLFYLGNYYERNIDYTTKNVSSILEPILLVLVGLAVAVLAIAIILPIYQFTGSISIL